MTKGAQRHRGLWVLLTLVPFGLATWAAFAYAGTRAHVTRWKVYAALYGIVAWVSFAVVGSTDLDALANDIGAAGIIGVWVIGCAHALIVRPAYLRRVNALGTHVDEAQRRLEQREEALRIARERPELALELGVGRPDRQGAMDAGLIDVNSAPLAVIQRLPGIDDATARRIVAVREELDGFTSLEDLGMTLDLDGETVADLRDRTVFLPR